MAEYLDKQWLDKIKDIKGTSNLVSKNSPKLVIDEKKKELFFSSEKRVEDTEKFNDFVAAQIQKLQELKEDIESNETSELVRNYYEEIVDAKIYHLEIKRITYDQKLKPEEKSTKIGEIRNKAYPLPPQEYIVLFINEFIEFFQYLYHNKLYKVHEIEKFDELLSHEFYSVEKVETNIQLPASVESYVFFGKEENRNLKEELSPEQVKKVLSRFIEKVDFDKKTKLKITKKDIFSVNSNRCIKIPSKTNISKRRVYELIAHEVLIHTGRSICGKENLNEHGQKLMLLEKGKVGSVLRIEEGLAIYFEQNIFYESNKYDVLNLFNFYMRMISVHLALHFKPYEVYKKIERLALLQARLKAKDDIYAFKQRDTLISRIYRGYEMPVQGAVNGKVSFYLYGNRQVWEYQEKGGDIFNLFAGKVTMDQIDKVKQLGFKVPEEFLGYKEFPREFLLRTIEECF
jgi:hypothetical protein